MHEPELVYFDNRTRLEIFASTDGLNSSLYAYIKYTNKLNNEIHYSNINLYITLNTHVKPKI